MHKFIIDNQEVEYTPGESIIQAAKNAGIEIPNFCWHPGLSVAGNCRICLVEVEKMPKLAIACATPVTDGMVVYTKSKRTIHAQNAVMEFLLINHPLDCPICDEAGECKLQDYAYKYSVGISRFDEEKFKKDKRVDIGPNVMFDGDRCISCSRCIRFCDEIAKSPQLTFVRRGEMVTIRTFPGEELDNPYSMNVIEICPVGALTSKDFRFRSRVWEMSNTESICPGCSRGCNTRLGVRNNEILRIEPRENLEVNDYWLCDYGRLNTFKYVNDKNLRISEPIIKLDEPENEKKDTVETGWDEAISKAVSILRRYNSSEILFVASPFSTMEDNYALKKFATEIIKTENIFYIPLIDESFEDDILRKADKTPNATGLKLLGINPYNNNDIADLKSRKYKLIYVLNDDFSRISEYSEFSKHIDVSIQHLQVRTKFMNNAIVIFPDSTYAEINGTFVNFMNRIQRIKPAVATIEKERLIGEFSLSRWDKFGAPNDRWTHGKKFNSRPAWKVIKQLAKAFGTDFGFNNTEEVYIELANAIPGLEGTDYEAIGQKGLLITSNIKAEV